MTLKTCTKCKTEFPDTNDFFYIRNEKGCKRRLSTECLNCHNERGKKWAKNNPEKVKECERKRYLKHREKRKLHVKLWNDKHPNAGKIRMKRWRKNHPMEAKRKSIKENTIRARNLGFTLLFDNPFEENIPIDYHHISDAFVVVLPRSLHTSHLGKTHRDDLKPYVESIYNITYNIMETLK